MTQPSGRLQATIFPTPLRGSDTLVLHGVFPANGMSLSPLITLCHETADAIGVFRTDSGLYVLPVGNPDAPSLHVIAEALVEPQAFHAEPYRSSSRAIEWLENCLPEGFLDEVIDEVVQAYRQQQAQLNITHPVPGDSRELFHQVRQHFRSKHYAPQVDCPRAWFLLGAPFPPPSNNDQ